MHKKVDFEETVKNIKNGHEVRNHALELADNKPTLALAILAQALTELLINTSTDDEAANQDRVKWYGDNIYENYLAQMDLYRAMKKGDI